MPTYRVKLAAGLDFPVGFEFETENLHPVMLQHVEVVGGSPTKAAKADDDSENDDPLTEAQLNKLHAEALKEDAKRFPPPPKDAKPAKVTPATGPGENS